MSSESEYAKLLDSDKVKNLLNGDGSLDVLLARLKQSITTAEELSKFVKKKAVIEDDHYNQLKKFSAHTRSAMKGSSKIKQDSLSLALDRIIGFDEKLFNVGNSYVTALNVMYDEISALVNTMTRTRKAIKEEARKKEKECQEAIMAADKARQKYNHLCEDLEKLKSSDPNKKSFSLKNKSAEQQEDDLQRKVDTADQEYKLRVAICKKLKDELLMMHRPNVSKRLKNLILEMDIAMNLQLQKYATWNETLIMNSGVLISPLKQEGSNKPSMRSLASSIDNEKDLYDYLLKREKQLSSKSLVPVEYRVHSSLAKSPGQKPLKPFLAVNNNAMGTTGISTSKSKDNVNINNNTTSGSTVAKGSPNNLSNSQSNHGPAQENDYSKFTYSSLDPASTPGTPNLNGPKTLNAQLNNYPQPTFGVSIEDIIKFAGIDNVPLIVKKCIDVIEAYGLDIEGIYRTSGNVTTVQHLRDSIDQNFTNYLLIGNSIDPDNVLDADIYCIASLLKNYFSSLPEPLLTREYCDSFIETVKSNDENYIAKKIHHLVYNLPDGAYFTLRVLVFHLNKVAAHLSQNRMTAKSLAIIWGPALFNDNSMNPQDLGYKSKVVEELMLIANDIFDTDDA